MRCLNFVEVQSDVESQHIQSEVTTDSVNEAGQQNTCMTVSPVSQYSPAFICLVNVVTTGNQPLSHIHALHCGPVRVSYYRLAAHLSKHTRNHKLTFIHSPAHHF